MVEFYQAHAAYEDLMKLTQNLITDLAFQLSEGSGILPFGEHNINYGGWGKVTYENALKAAGVEDPWSIESLRQFIVRFDSNFDLSLDLGELQQLIFDRWIEPKLINPTFITQYPVSFSPLARRNNDDPRVTDRFELFIAGSEIANGFSELNDPIDQAERFAAQAKKKADGDEEAMFFDEDYIKALSYGMPPVGGEGIGIDRLVMLLTNNSNIRDVILFPTMKKAV
jgi:lysyl-tRNA synthetase class 2